MRNWMKLVEAAQHDWYHGTTKSFTAFSSAFTRGQLGIHLGSRDQAEWRLGNAFGYILRVHVNDVSNLIRLQDEGSWYGSQFVQQLRQNPLTSDLKLHNSMGDNQIRNLLQRLGYDGVIYLNKHEGDEPADSIIVFNPQQLQIVSSEPVNIGGDS